MSAAKKPPRRVVWVWEFEGRLLWRFCFGKEQPPDDLNDGGRWVRFIESPERKCGPKCSGYGCPDRRAPLRAKEKR